MPAPQLEAAQDGASERSKKLKRSKALITTAITSPGKLNLNKRAAKEISEYKLKKYKSVTLSI